MLFDAGAAPDGCVMLSRAIMTKHPSSAPAALASAADVVPVSNAIRSTPLGFVPLVFAEMATCTGRACRLTGGVGGAGVAFVATSTPGSYSERFRTCVLIT